MAIMLLLISILSENQKTGQLPSPIHVDVCELNTYGPYAAQQIILRRWSDSPHGPGHWITDWRSVVSSEVSGWPNRSVVKFTDTNGNDYEVIARSYRETRTANDVEVMERKLYPEENRIPQLR